MRGVHSELFRASLSLLFVLAFSDRPVATLDSAYNTPPPLQKQRPEPSSIHFPSYEYYNQNVNYQPKNSQQIHQSNYENNYQPNYRPNYQPNYQPNHQPNYQPNFFNTQQSSPNAQENSVSTPQKSSPISSGADIFSFDMFLVSFVRLFVCLR